MPFRPLDSAPAVKGFKPLDAEAPPAPGLRARVTELLAGSVTPVGQERMDRLERVEAPVEVPRPAGAGVMFDVASPLEQSRARVSAPPALPATAGPVPGVAPTISNVAADLAGTLPDSLAGMKQGARALYGDLFNVPGMRADALRRAGQLELEGAESAPAFEGATAQGLYGGAKSIVQTAPAVALAFANPLAGLTAMGAQTGLPDYARFRERGATPLQAAPAAAGTAATEMVTEAMPMGFLVKNLGRVGAGRFLAGLLGREVPGEQVATIVQDAIDTATANPDKTWGQYLAERPDAAYQTLLATLVQTGAYGALHKVAQQARPARPQEPDLRALVEAAGFSSARPPTPAPAQPDAPRSGAAKNLAAAIDAAAPPPVTPPVAPPVTPPVTPTAAPTPAPVPPTPAPVPPAPPKPVLQNRNRGNAASVAQMNAIAAAPDPARLSFSREFATGAPVVFSNDDAATIPPAQLGRTDTLTDANGKRYEVQYAVLEADDVLTSNRADGTPVRMYELDNPGLIRTIAGNARMAGLQAGYERGTTGPYVEGIAADSALHGVDPAVLRGMNKPVLVRVMKQADVTADIGDVSNQSGVSALNATEQAQTDMARVDFERLTFDDHGNPTLQSVLEFIQAMPAAEQGGLMVGKGQPDKRASERLMAATFAKAYGDPALVELYAQATDPDAKAVLSGLAQAAGSMAKLDGLADYDLRTHLTAAAQQAVNAARRGIPLPKLLAQLDMSTTPEAGEFLRLFLAPDKNGVQRVASSKRIGELMRDIADRLYTEATRPEADMFGAVEKQAPAAILKGPPNEQQASLAVGEPAGPATAAYDRAAPADGRGSQEVRPGAQAAARQPAESETDLLTNPTPAELRRREQQRILDERAQQRQQREGQAPSPDDFRLTGSDLDADQAAAAGQASLFDRDRKDTHTQDLFDAPVQGRQRVDAQPAGQPDRAGGAVRTVSTRVAKDIPGATKPRPRIIAKGVADEFEQAGVAYLVGREVNDAQELAALAQIYRDPRYETFRYILTKGNRVVYETAVSSRMPKQTAFFPAGTDQFGFARELTAQMEALGADGYWLMHNHPSGTPNASDADIDVTTALSYMLDGFKGHVIINSGQFGLIQPTVGPLGRATSERTATAVRLHNYAGDKILAAAEPHPWLGATITGPKDVAAVGKGLHHERQVALIGMNARGRVQLLAEAPVTLFANPVKAAAWMRRLGITGAGGEMFVYAQDDFDLNPYMRTFAELRDKGFLTDVVYGNGQSAIGPIAWDKRGSYGRTANEGGRVVRADLPRYEAQTPATQALWHQGDEHLPGSPDELTPAQRAVYDTISRAPAEGKFALKTQAERDIEQRAAIKIAVRGWDAIEAEYDALPETKGGKILNTDTARELFNDYLADRTQAAAVHEPASDVIKALYKRKLARLTGAGIDGEKPLVLFTAGGTGAGKSSGFKQFADAGYIERNAAVIYDTNVADAKKGIEKMQQAIDAGYNVFVMHTVRDPVVALLAGALSRAENQAKKFGSGRTVPLAEHIKTHIHANRAIGAVVAHFAGNRSFAYSVVDNRYAAGEAQYIDLAAIPQYNEKELEGPIRAALDNAYATGKISEKTYRGFAGQDARLPARHDAGVGAEGARGVPGAVQSQREGRQEERPDAVGERDTAYGRDLEDQATWLTEQAKDAGHDSIDALAERDPARFMRLATQWRAEHPMPAAEAGAPYGVVRRGRLIDPVTGRFVPGEKAYAAVEKYVGGMLAKVGFAHDTPLAFRRLLQRYKADQGKASLAASDVLEAAKELPPAERELLSDFVEGEVRAGVAVPEHIVDVAQSLDIAINRQTRQLVELGMLTEQAAARWQGRYLPRYYTKDLEKAPLWRRALRVGLKANHMKARGLLELVPLDMVDHFKAQGFEVREGMDTGDDNLVAMWRDFTKAERERMGEVRDAAYRFARGTLEVGNDIAAARLFKAIAENPRFATDNRTVAHARGWKQVPNEEIEGTALKKFGLLSGMFVDPKVWKELQYSFRDVGELERSLAMLMAAWKEGKTAMNPATHAANVSSNIIMADIAGIPPYRLDKYAKILKDFKRNGPLTREAIEIGLLGGEALDELREWLPDPGDVLRGANGSPTGLAALFNSRAVLMVGKYSGASFYRKHMRNLYGAEDAFFKLLIYSHYRERGMEQEQAAGEANRYIFDYRDLPRGVKWIRTHAIPFISYTYKAIPAVVHAWMTRPWVIAKYAALFHGINALAYALGGDDDEEYERRNLPDYMAGWSPLGYPSHIRVMDDAAGNPQFLNVARLSPLGTGLLDGVNGNGLAWPAAFVLSHPVAQAYMTLIHNLHPISGDKFFKDSDDARDRAFKTSRYLFQQLAPATPALPGTQAWDKIANGVVNAFDAPIDMPEVGISYTGRSEGRSGREETLPKAVANTVFGFNIRGADPARGEQNALREAQKEISELKANIRRHQTNEGIGDATRAARIEREREKIRKVQERMQR